MHGQIQAAGILAGRGSLVAVELHAEMARVKATPECPDDMLHLLGHAVGQLLEVDLGDQTLAVAVFINEYSWRLVSSMLL